MNTERVEGLGLLVHDAARLMRRRFEESASGHGLSAAQWRLLVRLVKAEGVAQARLAALLEIEPISVSRLLDRMEEGGWIERRPDPSDRRVRTVFATDKSREAFAEVKGMASDIYDEALAGLSAEERRTLINGLRTLISNLSDGEGAGESCKTAAKEDVS
ncbi:MarR family transcriptional regulator [Aquamicrobium sp. LC103]|uniref:MarR family winged helix-turn-helix transcriptional regulator n=1 Tax=Aquamicrobium sp. LC103 TaxID=1120658 RepID=UPI00063EB218|nr:MarR family transcriptional regulator [Aquamicrobium sp. LC103]TKT74859.1 MarR family transcriptional regulator [Aquamicrobium sp. LC103]